MIKLWFWKFLECYFTDTCVFFWKSGWFWSDCLNVKCKGWNNLHSDWLLQVVPCIGRYSGGENRNLQCDICGHHYGSDSKNAESTDGKWALSDRGNQSDSKWRLQANQTAQNLKGACKLLIYWVADELSNWKYKTNHIWGFLYISWWTEAQHCFQLCW